MLKEPDDRVATRLQELILDEFGKEIYRDKNPNNVSRRYLLTRTKLSDMLHDHCVDAPIAHFAPEVRSPRGGILHELAPNELRRFETVARLGHCALGKRGINPQSFVHPHLIRLAHRLRTELLAEVV